MSTASTDAPGSFEAPPGAPKFLIHNEGDHVGVAVQDIAPGDAEGVYMDSDRVVATRVVEHVPLGHKVALEALPAGAEVIEYGVCVGITRAAIGRGDLVHTHNIRSARWQASV
ncbi:MAG TPA: UxaA family hydrolase [Acidimicrobiales bacterium]|jgi:(2R)-sulfolactate sulfo-lyase subunit alpha|nr:UxaA family hydrolase [Acidimicrobiales bacterium]